VTTRPATPEAGGSDLHGDRLAPGSGDADDTFLPASQHSEDTVSGYIRFRKPTQ
jgi:hypothetical protein